MNTIDKSGLWVRSSLANVAREGDALDRLKRMSDSTRGKNGDALFEGWYALRLQWCERVEVLRGLGCLLHCGVVGA